MSKRVYLLTVMLLIGIAGTARAQTPQCLHDQNETPDQAGRRRGALNAARVVNTIEAAGGGAFLSHADLASSSVWSKMRTSGGDKTRAISLTPNDDIVPGWKLTLDLGERSYWFMIKDTTDPCGFAFVSNQSGLILKAEPIR